MKNINNIIAVFAGGGLGALLRYGVSNTVKNNINGFPLATFVVNVFGCFIIGILYNLIKIENVNLRLFLIIGLLGGFTTFSTFGNETFQLLNSGKYSTAFFYVILSNITCISSVYAGTKISLLF